MKKKRKKGAEIFPFQVIQEGAHQRNALNPMTV
jgi:hypothetical protein